MENGPSILLAPVHLMVHNYGPAVCADMIGLADLDAEMKWVGIRRDPPRVATTT